MRSARCLYTLGCRANRSFYVPTPSVCAAPGSPCSRCPDLRWQLCAIFSVDRLRTASKTAPVSTTDSSRRAALKHRGLTLAARRPMCGQSIGPATQTGPMNPNPSNFPHELHKLPAMQKRGKAKRYPVPSPFIWVSLERSRQPLDEVLASPDLDDRHTYDGVSK